MSGNGSALYNDIPVGTEVCLTDRHSGSRWIGSIRIFNACPLLTDGILFMNKSEFRTEPLATASMPSGVVHLVVNEGAERFSYYGMRSILVVFMTGMLLNTQGNLDPMGEAEAKSYFHLFASAVYFFPFLGAILADAFLGKYKTIILLSLVYCGGHVVLALDHTRFGLLVGLTLIAIGSGGI